jgi:hypothetical protein
MTVTNRTEPRDHAGLEVLGYDECLVIRPDTVSGRRL